MTRRWSKEGNACDQSPQQGGIDPNLLEFLRDHHSFNSAVTPLVELGFIRRPHSKESSRIEILPTTQEFVRENMTSADRLQWLFKTICLVSHAMPEDPSPDTGSEVTRSELLPHVFRCVEHSREFQPHRLKLVLPQLLTMLLTSLARAGRELDYIDELVKENDDGFYRCLAAKWGTYRWDSLCGIRINWLTCLTAPPVRGRTMRPNNCYIPNRLLRHGCKHPTALVRVRMLLLETSSCIEPSFSFTRSDMRMACTS